MEENDASGLGVKGPSPDGSGEGEMDPETSCDGRGEVDGVGSSDPGMGLVLVGVCEGVRVREKGGSDEMENEILSEADGDVDVVSEGEVDGLAVEDIVSDGDVDGLAV